MSTRRMYVRALLHQPAGLISLVVVAALAALAVVGPIIWGPAAAQIDPLQASQGASSAHLLGTDELGRDVLARTLAATRLSLLLAVLATVVSAGLGIATGVLLASVGRVRVRSNAARVLDALLAFPPIIVALFFATIFGLGGPGAAVAVGIAVAPRFARFAYTLSLSVRGQDFVAAARSLGLSSWAITRRHVVPNMIEPLLVTSFLAVGFAIVTVSALSFLGLGVQPLQYDWGSLLTSAVKNLYINPITAVGPALAIILAGTAFGSLGEALAAAADPRTWTVKRHEPVPEPEPEALPALAGESAVPRGEDVTLRVEGLRVQIPTDQGLVRAVDGVSLTVRKGEVVGLVGESGSGKSMTVLALAGLAPPNAEVTARRFEVCGEISTDPPESTAEGLAIVFQEPSTALNPALRVQTQMTEALRAHRKLGRKEARAVALRALNDVHLAAPEMRMRQYPHELSGGMQQRVAIAMGLAMEPALLLADEPTTALDVTLQAQIIGVLKELTERGMGLLLVSHDIGVVAEVCDRIAVMYAGRIVEEGPTAAVLDDPLHPYTRGLIESLPALDGDRERELAAIPGSPLQPGDEQFGCPFAPRCEYAVDRCALRRPELDELKPGHRVACPESDLAAAAPHRSGVS